MVKHTGRTQDRTLGSQGTLGQLLTSSLLHCIHPNPTLTDSPAQLWNFPMVLLLLTSLYNWFSHSIQSYNDSVMVELEIKQHSVVLTCLSKLRSCHCLRPSPAASFLPTSFPPLPLTSTHTAFLGWKVLLPLFTQQASTLPDPSVSPHYKVLLDHLFEVVSYYLVYCINDGFYRLHRF